MADPAPGTSPSYTAGDYATAMASLLPRGRAWPRDPDTMLMALLGALAPTYERSNAAAAALIRDIFPATTTALIPEWEASLGLPDECTPLGASAEQRRAAILAKFIGGGGQSVPYFISVVAALGIVATISEYAPFRVDHDTVETPLYDDAWWHTWAITAPLTTIGYFQVELNTCEDPLAWWGNAELECRLNKIKPAHTILQFHYV
jgi:uncharacterized protein YmfQ (DUF2313 family)